jgi:hypothetical protein
VAVVLLYVVKAAPTFLKYRYDQPFCPLPVRIPHLSHFFSFVSGTVLCPVLPLHGHIRRRRTAPRLGRILIFFFPTKAALCLGPTARTREILAPTWAWSPALLRHRRTSSSPSSSSTTSSTSPGPLPRYTRAPAPQIDPGDHLLELRLDHVVALLGRRYRDGGEHRPL